MAVGQDASGKDLTVKIIYIKGKGQTAPSVYMQASMHAAEIQGNAVIFELLAHFCQKQPLGDITIIPQCNPIGLMHRAGAGHQGRFDAMNGDNWNRYYLCPEIDYDAFAQSHITSDTAAYKREFKTLLAAEIDKALSDNLSLTRAKRLAYSVQRHAVKADIVLDLHTDTNAIDYLYSPLYAQEASGQFGFAHVLLIGNNFGGAMDEAIFCPWWRLQQAFLRQNRKEDVLIDSFTLELGPEEVIDQKRAQRQADGIVNYLAYKNVLPASPKGIKTVQYHTRESFKAIYAPRGGLYEWFISPGQKVQKDQVIGRCLQMANNQSFDITLPYNGLVVSINGKGALPQSAHILNLFTV